MNKKKFNQHPPILAKEIFDSILSVLWAGWFGLLVLPTLSKATCWEFYFLGDWNHLFAQDCPTHSKVIWEWEDDWFGSIVVVVGFDSIGLADLAGLGSSSVGWFGFVGFDFGFVVGLDELAKTATLKCPPILAKATLE